jgi:hypothetical protein
MLFALIRRKGGQVNRGILRLETKQFPTDQPTVRTLTSGSGSHSDSDSGPPASASFFACARINSTDTQTLVADQTDLMRENMVTQEM